MDLASSRGWKRARDFVYILGKETPSTDGAGQRCRECSENAPKVTRGVEPTAESPQHL